MADFTIKQILNTDLFRLQPAGFTPSCCLSFTDPFKPRMETVPEGGAGETLLISDQSRVVIGDGEHARISAFYADRALKAHLIGNRLDRLPFVVRWRNTGAWRDRFETFAQHYEEYQQRLRELGFTADGSVPIARFSLEGTFASLCDRVAAVMNLIVEFNCSNPDLAVDETLKEHCSRMREVHNALFKSVPPLCLRYISATQPASDALMYVIKAEEGAELLLGWKGGTESEIGSRIRKKILLERMPARRYTNGTQAVQGFAHVIPPMFPFGMTVGVEALLVEPLQRSFVLDDWGRELLGNTWAALGGYISSGVHESMLQRCLSEELANSEASHMAIDALTRVFEECVVPPSTLGVDGARNGLYCQNVMNGLPFSSFLFNQFIVRFVRVSTGVDAFNLNSFGLVMAWVMLGGAMTVASPNGVELGLEEGDACLFPASASGEYKVKVDESGAQYMSVSAPIV
jgi:hypothetical protein